MMSTAQLDLRAARRELIAADTVTDPGGLVVRGRLLACDGRTAARNSAGSFGSPATRR
jgi:hypothetical protein